MVTYVCLLFGSCGESRENGFCRYPSKTRRHSDSVLYRIVSRARMLYSCYGHHAPSRFKRRLRGEELEGSELSLSRCAPCRSFSGTNDLSPTQHACRPSLRPLFYVRLFPRLGSALVACLRTLVPSSLRRSRASFSRGPLSPRHPCALLLLLVVCSPRVFSVAVFSRLSRQYLQLPTYIHTYILRVQQYTAASLLRRRFGERGGAGGGIDAPIGLGWMQSNESRHGEAPDPASLSEVTLKSPPCEGVPPNQTGHQQVCLKCLRVGVHACVRACATRAG